MGNMEDEGYKTPVQEGVANVFREIENTQKRERNRALLSIAAILFGLFAIFAAIVFVISQRH